MNDRATEPADNLAENAPEQYSDSLSIRIRGARVHNLRNVNLDVPRDQLVVVTGPSGSGKSSLAYDTLYAEGQRQYIESLSVYARQFLHQIERPDVDMIDGLQPTISIDQRASVRNPRSTVATVTEIYDYLRLLMARLGDPVCYKCGEPIRQQTPDQIFEDIMDLPSGTRTMIMAPIVRGRRGEHREVIETIRKAGFVRARIDGQVIDVQEPPELARGQAHNIEAVVDRVVIREGIDERVRESVNLAIRHGEGLVSVCYEEERGDKANGTQSVWRDVLFSTLYACPHCKISYEEVEPRTFSFNSPYGVCPKCEGLGVRVRFDPELVMPNIKLSLGGGAIASWKGASAQAQRKHKEALREFMSTAGFRWNTPLEKLSDEVREQLLHGFAGKGKLSPSHTAEGEHATKPDDGGKTDGQFDGVLAMLEKEYASTTSDSVRQRLDTFRSRMTCSACHGSRLRPEAGSVRIAGKAIHEITAMTVTQAAEFLGRLEFHEDEEPIAEPILSEIASRLDFLAKVGLDYL
ncbi:MAG: ABC-ATPase UvrA, partial [Pirellulales bacterium]|nr:ABC-ATPase UvrA [Pirellulales bacterium]